MSTFILVSGYKGGVAKTTTAVHLAAYYSGASTTLLVDGDPNRSSMSWHERGDGLGFDVVDEHQALRLVSRYETVIIDTPARPRTDDLRDLAKGADILVLPTACDIGSVEATIATSLDLPNDTRFKILLCRCPPKPSHDADDVYEELKAAELPVFESRIRRAIGFNRAMLEGCAIRDLKKGAERMAWQDYKKLGKEIDQWLTEIN